MCVILFTAFLIHVLLSLLKRRPSVVLVAYTLNPYNYEYRSRALFTNGFSIAIQIRWKFRCTLISILIQWSLRNFAHGTTAVLSWHVQNIVAIWWQATELQQGKVSIEFELRAKIVNETGPGSNMHLHLPVLRRYFKVMSIALLESWRSPSGDEATL